MRACRFVVGVLAVVVVAVHACPVGSGADPGLVTEPSAETEKLVKSTRIWLDDGGSEPWETCRLPSSLAPVAVTVGERFGLRVTSNTASTGFSWDLEGVEREDVEVVACFLQPRSPPPLPAKGRRPAAPRMTGASMLETWILRLRPSAAGPADASTPTAMTLTLALRRPWESRDEDPAKTCRWPLLVAPLTESHETSPSGP